MPGKKDEDETYSLIFASLRHPIRRRILRMLSDRQMTFSQILAVLSIDSGHLSYHIENLGELIAHSSNGKYTLSSVGVAAVKLMSGVEEQPKPFASQKTKQTLIGDFAKIYAMSLAIVLAVASLYFVNFTTVEQPFSIVAGRGALKTIALGQLYHYNITMVYKEAGLRVSDFIAFDSVSGYYVTTVYKEPEVNRYDENGSYMERYPPKNTITSWTRCYFFFGLETNDTYDLSIRVVDPDGAV